MQDLSLLGVHQHVHYEREIYHEKCDPECRLYRHRKEENVQLRSGSVHETKTEGRKEHHNDDRSGNDERFPEHVIHGEKYVRGGIGGHPHTDSEHRPDLKALVQCAKQDKHCPAHEEYGRCDLGEEYAECRDLRSAERRIDLAHCRSTLVVDEVADVLRNPERNGREEPDYETDERLLQSNKREHPEIGFARRHRIMDDRNHEEREGKHSGTPRNAGNHGVRKGRTYRKCAAYARHRDDGGKYPAMELHIVHLSAQQRELGEDVLRVKQHFATHPRARRHYRDSYRDQLHGEPQCLLLYLRERLKERYDETNHRSDDDRYEREPEHKDQTRLCIVKQLRLVHQMYPLMRPCMRSVHPFTITNSSSLNGSDIVTGDTIIIPIASRMFDTIMSIAMNGRYTRKPI